MIARDCAAEAVPCDHKTLEMAGAGPDHRKSAARVHSGSMHPASAGSRCGCNVTSRLWVLLTDNIMCGLWLLCAGYGFCQAIEITQKNKVVTTK